MDGELVYFDIPVADTGRARAFYGGLFGWQFAPGNFDDYLMITNATPMAALDGGGEGSRPRVYFGVRDIAVAVARVRDLGGHADDPRGIPSGHFADCRDDQGTQFRLWQDKGAG